MDFKANLKKIYSRYLFALLVIPVNELSQWKIESYSNMTPNQVSVVNQTLQIKVSASSSPLFYPLKKTSIVKGFKLKVHFIGLPVFKELERQGEKNFDDFALRIGFVVPGDKKLQGIKKMFAASWVKRLYSQIPEGSGIDHVQFYNIVQNKNLVGKVRIHPQSDLIYENFFMSIDKPSLLETEYIFEKPIHAQALWISLDGDDTKSNYEI